MDLPDIFSVKTLSREDAIQLPICILVYCADSFVSDMRCHDNEVLFCSSCGVSKVFRTIEKACQETKFQNLWNT